MSFARPVLTQTSNNSSSGQKIYSNQISPQDNRRQNTSQEIIERPFGSPVNINHSYQVSPKLNNHIVQSNIDSQNYLVMNRIDKMEEIISRVCSQYDALMPLIQLADQAPTLMKSDILIKNMQKKIQNLEEKNLKQESSVVKLQQFLENTKFLSKEQFQTETQKFELKIKDFTKNTEDQLKNFKDIENRFNKLLKQAELKIKEDVAIYNKRSESRYLSLEEKIQQSNEELNAKFTELDLERQKMSRRMNFNSSEQAKRMSLINQTGHQASRQSSFIGTGSQIDIAKEVMRENDRKIEFFQKKFEKEINDLSNIVGMLQCIHEYDREQNKRFQVGQDMSDSKVENNVDKMVQINSLENYFYLDSLEKFNIENTQRIIYEMKNQRDKIDLLEGSISNLRKNSQNQMSGIDNSAILNQCEIIIDSLKQTQIQIQGASKKCFQDLKQIQLKLDKLESLNEKLSKNPALGQQIESLKAQNLQTQQRFEQIKNSVDQNIKVMNENLKELQDKIDKQYKNLQNQQLRLSSDISQDISISKRQNDSFSPSKRLQVNSNQKYGSSFIQ